jgi:hypothetical protein
MEEKKTAAELYSTAIMEATTALTGAGFSILNATGLDSYSLRSRDLGSYIPDSVQLSLTIVREAKSF